MDQDIWLLSHLTMTIELEISRNKIQIQMPKMPVFFYIIKSSATKDGVVSYLHQAESVTKAFTSSFECCIQKYDNI